MTKPVSKSPKKSKPASSVGQTLKARRLARSLSLAEVERATRIRGKYLVAIEADDYATLPHDIYTKGFIRSYARYLGLSEANLVASYTQERGRDGQQLRRRRRLGAVRFT